MMTSLGVGDLLGIRWEGRSAAAIRSKNPRGVREITAGEGYPDDDDLAQAILLAEACIERDQLEIDDLVKRFWTWGELNGAGMGYLTRRVLSRYGGAKPGRQLRNWVRYGSAAGGRALAPR